MSHRSLAGKCGGFPAGLSPIRVSADWQQTEQLSKVAMPDPALEHQPQPNSSPYLLTVPFGELTLFYLSLFPCSFIAPPLSSWQCEGATSVDWVMRRWVPVSQPFFNSLLLPLWTSVFAIFSLLKDCLLLHVTSWASIAIFANMVLSPQCLLRDNTRLSLQCLCIVFLLNHSSC